MTIHYQNGNGDERFISGVIHLQNVDDRVFIATMETGAELTLLVERIEGIYYRDREGKQMKGVLISIRPKWVEKIASGKKTIEVRKSRPKLEAPFKCYIYYTKAVVAKRSLHAYINTGYGRKNFGAIGKWRNKKEIIVINSPTSGCRYEALLAEGKVIGEFTCYSIKKWEKYMHFIQDWDLEQACLTYSDFWKYGKGKNLYGWHISDLKIYDKPKELSEFRKPCNSAPTAECYPDNCGFCWWNVITRPPQSWCYVEEL